MCHTLCFVFHTEQDFWLDYMEFYRSFLYAEHIMENAGLDKAQDEIKIARRNINSLRYADDTTVIGRKQRGIKEPLDESERGQ